MLFRSRQLQLHNFCNLHDSLLRPLHKHRITRIYEQVYFCLVQTFISLYNLCFFFLAIITAAMEMLAGGKDAAIHCRTPDIMSDAAYIMLTR